MDFRIRDFEEYKAVYERSVQDPEGFWAEIAENYTWMKKWDEVFDWEFDTPSITWYKKARLNITENCLDRHLEKRGNKLALIWEPNDPKERPVRYTYRELYEGVCRFANVLKSKGIKKGDRVAIYMPMIPELTMALLACARVGAV
ncbi:MAG TPA: AMP-binding protein, partial [Cryomorphaceae bacterium]|nr:AMP-binding protein [Cryomorphaceae bacterium]